jgi:uncharacterized protein (DUF697 family)
LELVLPAGTLTTVDGGGGKKRVSAVFGFTQLGFVHSQYFTSVRYLNTPVVGSITTAVATLP